MLPVVIVPVLSKQSTSTRARVSTQYSSCTRTFFLASFIAATAKDTLTSRINPSGIIPTNAPALRKTISVYPRPRLAPLT